MKAYPDCNGDRVKTCPDCNGDGVVDKDTDDERQCPTCGGLGFVPDDDDHEEVIKTSLGRASITLWIAKPRTRAAFFRRLNRPSGVAKQTLNVRPERCCHISSHLSR